MTHEPLTMPSIPPSISASLLDPPTEDPAFVFPDEEPTPARSFSRPPPAAEEGTKHRLGGHRLHRPHLHIHSSAQRKEKHRTIAGTGAGATTLHPSPAHAPPPASTRNLPTNSNGDAKANDDNARNSAGGGGGTFLTVPKTYSPHARSLDSASRTPSANSTGHTDGNEQQHQRQQQKQQQEDEEIHSTSSPASYFASGGGELSDTTTTTTTTSTTNTVKNASEDPLSRAYGFPPTATATTTTPAAPVDAAASSAPAQATGIKNAANGTINNVSNSNDGHPTALAAADADAVSAGQAGTGNGDDHAVKMMGEKGKEGSSVVVSLSVWDQIKMERDLKQGVEPS
ncbi:hypothetical protein QFC24_001930 [Naganishia onofrii]|uniref:Uncharacterized protein n=1 Tax=Naganishia onofrii TaxID=1851511 RepID=A0ACC2XS89_9TREE|nr:hypothetical protein QFC24_001930 [Naganishia onofrii]